MLDVDALTNGQPRPAEQREQPEDARGGQDSLGQEDFLDLMITQLRNQDPLDPQDGGEFLGQMAQFTVANGITALQDSFDEFQRSMGQDQALKAAGLVGRDVLVESDAMPLGEQGLSGVARVPAGVENLTVRIQNGVGETVREIEMGQQEEGDVPFHWDGLDDSGTAQPAGTYTVRAEVQSGDETQSLQTLAAAGVNSVSLENDGRSPRLSLEGLGEVDLDAVRHIQ